MGEKNRGDTAIAPRRRSTEQIRAQLLAAAGTEFRSHGYAGATTAAIARRAGVAEVQLFRAFATKAELFRAAILDPLTGHFRAFQQVHAPLATDAASFLTHGRTYIAELTAFLREQAPALISLFDAQTFPSRDGAESEAIRSGLQGFFEESAALLGARMEPARILAPSTPASPPDRDPAMLTRIAFGTLLGCITYAGWLFPDPQAQAAAIDQAITDFVLTGIGPLAASV